MNKENERWPMGCRRIAVPGVRDERGALIFAEAGRTIPFEVKRVFWIYDVPTNAERGGHAHWTCSEVVVPVKGGVTVTLDDGRNTCSIKLERPDEGVLIPAGVWCRLTDFVEGTVLVVMASDKYDPQGYVHDYDEYLRIKTEVK